MRLGSPAIEIEFETNFKPTTQVTKNRNDQQLHRNNREQEVDDIVEPTAWLST